MSLSFATSPYLSPRGAPPTYELLGFLLTVPLGSAQSGGHLAVVEERGRRGAGTPLHRHSREAETFVVLEGELDGWSAGTHLVVAEGGTLHLPPGQDNAFAVRSEMARFLCIITPAGFEQLFLDDGVPSDATEPPLPLGPPPPEAVERLAALLETYGVDITGPPPS